ncbi:hypothetical protein H2O64_18400 [Kordia sp. YSTF-M3]|uniref:Class I lanthipeptide n=1 Tax=Kordia aestuariivivens TaxID=2759037 RepID=A0ABR7QDN4_9FLAO|nr:hypothetical protein [Kordia aestuariivivens]MBC8756650.1 hypothetical protein [Kordia aestuariivivens]
MKKNIKSLTLTKRKISSLNQLEVTGGVVGSATPTILITISQLICPVQSKLPVKPLASADCR